MTLSARLLASAMIAALGLFGTAVGAQTPMPPAQPEGTWSGTSKCTPQAVICDDKLIIVRVSPDPQLLTYDVDLATVENGVEVPEDHLVMKFNPVRQVLTARFLDEHKRLNFYALAVKADNMAGVLLIDDRVIERDLKLIRIAAKATPQPTFGSASSASSSADSTSSATSSSQ